MVNDLDYEDIEFSVCKKKKVLVVFNIKTIFALMYFVMKMI